MNYQSMVRKAVFIEMKLSNANKIRGENTTMHIFKKKMALFFIFITMTTVMLFAIPEQGYAAPANSSSIGIVDYVYLINKHPDTKNSNDALRSEAEQAKKEYAEKSVNMNDQDKHNLDQQLGQRIEQKRQDLLKPIMGKINEAIKEVADAKGLSVIVGKNVVIYGGVDITDDVLKKISGQ